MLHSHAAFRLQPLAPLGNEVQSDLCCVVQSLEGSDRKALGLMSFLSQLQLRKGAGGAATQQSLGGVPQTQAAEDQSTPTWSETSAGSSTSALEATALQPERDEDKTQDDQPAVLASSEVVGRAMDQGAVREAKQQQGRIRWLTRLTGAYSVAGAWQKASMLAKPVMLVSVHPIVATRCSGSCAIVTVGRDVHSFAHGKRTSHTDLPVWICQVQWTT